MFRVNHTPRFSAITFFIYFSQAGLIHSKQATYNAKKVSEKQKTAHQKTTGSEGFKYRASWRGKMRAKFYRKFYRVA
jgi:hypothetical protein